MPLPEDATAVVVSFWHILAAFQPPSLLTPLLAGLSLLYAASTGLAHQDI